MALPTSKSSLIDYCKRACGEPVIRVNLAPTQFDDCIDRAFEFWKDYSSSAQERFYIKYQITSTDISNGYITLPSYVQAVLRVVNTSSMGQFSWASYEYTLVRDAIFDAAKASGLSNYVVTRYYLAELDYVLNSAPAVHYNVTNNILRIDDDLSKKYTAGQFLAIEVMGWVDAQAYSKVWGDRLLMQLAVGEVKKQFGWNLKKFGSIQLPSGIQLDGQQFYDEGVQEIEETRAEIMEYQQPLGIIVG